MRPVLGLLPSLVPMSLTCAANATSTAAAAAAAITEYDEAPSIRSFFFVGGEYARPPGSNDSSSGHVFVNQMYVEKLVPVGGATQDLPIIFFHGRGQMGTNFLNTPDGRRGWASHFLTAGYEVYLTDEPFRGRSAWAPAHLAPQLKMYPAELIQQRFTAPERYNLWPSARLHTQWPRGPDPDPGSGSGSGVMGDPVFDQFFAANMPFLPDPSREQAATQAAGAALLDRVGRPAVLVGHSQGGPLPLLVADARPERAAALVLLEPAGPPFHEAVFSNASARAWGVTESAVTYEPPVTDPGPELVRAVRTYHDPERMACTLQAENPPPRRLKNVAGKDILVVTAEASYHSVYDHCTVDFLRQAGCDRLQHIYLHHVGIRGNGHMMFMEKNSHQIQQLVQRWIERLSQQS